MGGGKGSSGGSTTTVQKADPWEGQQPYLVGGIHINGVPIAGTFYEANKLYQNGQLAPEYYPGQTVADQSPWTQQALQMQADRAQNGSGVINSATDAIQDIMSGSGISGNQGLQTLNKMASASDSNPYLDAMYNRANNKAQASLNANFSKAGRYGSGAHEAASADAANNLATQLYGEAYDSDQNRRLSAAEGAGQLYNQGVGQQILGANAAQSLGNQAYTDSAALSEAGGIMDDYNQQKINADIDRYNYNAQRPLSALSAYNQLIQGNYGGTSTSTGKQSGGSNTLGSVLGSGLTGYGIGAGLSGLAGTAALTSPWALGGAALGGLLGLL